MKHTAKIIPGSVEDLGPNGIAFSVMCCDDPATTQRHTIVHAHTLTTAELEAVIRRRYLEPHAAAHKATAAHADHVRNLASEVKGDCGCH